MSDTQTVWMVLWRRAGRSKNPRDPFEIDEVVPEIVEALKIPKPAAAKLVVELMKELERLPDGKQFFRLEGNAIVPLPEYVKAPKDENSVLAAYPFEL